MNSPDTRSLLPKAALALYGAAANHRFPSSCLASVATIPSLPGLLTHWLQRLSATAHSFSFPQKAEHACLQIFVFWST